MERERQKKKKERKQNNWKHSAKSSNDNIKNENENSKDQAKTSSVSFGGVGEDEFVSIPTETRKKWNQFKSKRTDPTLMHRLNCNKELATAKEAKHKRRSHFGAKRRAFHSITIGCNAR